MDKRKMSMYTILAVLLVFVQLAVAHPVPAEASDRTKPLEKAVIELISKQPGDWQFYIKDLKRQEEIVFNSKPGTSASVIKIWLAAEAYRQEQNGTFSFQEKVVLDSSNKAGGSGVLRKRPDGTVVTYAELLDLMMTVSDNTATNLIIERFGWVNHNNLMKNLGCNDTTIGMMMFPPGGNPPGGNPPGYRNRTTVKDLGLVLEKLYKGEVVSPKADAELLNIMKKTKRVRIAGLLPKDIPVARKGGSLSKTKVLHDAGIIYGKHTDIIVTVMSFSNGKPTTNKESEKIVEQIGKLAFQHLDRP